MPGMWARLQADLNVRLRRGAWYRIKQLGPLQAVVEVRGRPLEVPSAFLQVVDSPPRTWSVVARPGDAGRLPSDVPGAVWYGGVLDPITVESSARDSHAAAQARIMSRPTVRCVGADRSTVRTIS